MVTDSMDEFSVLILADYVLRAAEALELGNVALAKNQLEQAKGSLAAILEPRPEDTLEQREKHAVR